MEQSESTAANPLRRSRPWFQFSLRGFLVVLTIGCMWLGSKVEKARTRGRAIDSMAMNGGAIVYEDAAGVLIVEPTAGHFWLDLAGRPVTIYVTDPLDAKLEPRLMPIHNIHEIFVTRTLTDNDLQYLCTINIPCRLSLLKAARLTDSGLTTLKRNLPHTTIRFSRGKGWVPLSRLDGVSK